MTETDRLLTVPSAVMQQQNEMVAALAKPGEAIVESLTPAKAHLLHMAVGMIGELIEMHDASDRENAVEEAGDFEFYFTGFMQGINATEEELRETEVEIGHTNFLSTVGVLLDLTKKFTVYNKDVDRDLFVQQLVRVGYFMDNVYVQTAEQQSNTDPITREEAIRHNINKLWTGENARYSSGSYSDEQAQARADKVDQE
ncbi:hypothetical protein [Marisediminitalea sp.]|uniref:hypothetical protein n=1 Tax=Marisediminitalea sp. TaxID=2662268 RepID=UPI00351268D5